MNRFPNKPLRMTMTLAALALCAVVFGAGSGPADRAQWGQRWSRNMASDEKLLADSFDPATGLNIKWQANLGTETHSTPVIAGGRVFIGTNNGNPRDPKHQGDRGVIMCFDEKDGKFLWQLVVPKRSESIYWDWPRAGICSPVTVEGNRVFVVTNRGEVASLDLLGMANGNDGPYRGEAQHSTPPGAEPAPLSPTDADIVWLFDTVKECGVRQHDSAHGSILVHGRYLYVNTSNGVDDSHRKINAPDAPSLIVLDKETGRLVATDGEHIGPRVFHSTWSSPALGTVNGRTLIFFCGGDGVVYAFEPLDAGAASAPPVQPLAEAGTKTTGSPRIGVLKKVWQYDCDPDFPRENVHLYIGNRRESPGNIMSMPVFYGNRVFVTVGGDLWWGKNQAWLKCLDAAKGGDISRSGGLWSYAMERHVMATPAIGGGLAFVADTGRKIHCLDAESGKPVWTHDVGDEIWASPLLADEKVYFATRQGEILVFRAGRKKELINTISLDQAISSSPVAANGVLYIATMNRLLAVQKTAR
jgi:outer membrane protein assembly factor BamB